jgi:hypothetical protein
MSLRRESRRGHDQTLSEAFHKTDRIHSFDESRLGVIRCSFLVSYSINLTASATSGWAET